MARTVIKDLDYSPVARLYAQLEHCVYGGMLEEARYQHLEYCADLLQIEAPKILLLGDGDGRFLERLLAILSPDARVDYVDCSPEMLRMARERVGGDVRVHWHQQSAEEFVGDSYQLVVMHFFLDHYEAEGRAALLARVSKMVEAGAGLLVSDFDPSVSRRGRLLMWLMQRFFGIVAGVPRVEVARADAELQQCGWELIASREWQSGWVYSQAWRKH